MRFICCVLKLKGNLTNRVAVHEGTEDIDGVR